jgi:predicted transcriptional regulator
MALTLRELRITAGLSITKLSVEAGIARQAVKNAETGHVIRAETAKAIAEALSKALGHDVKVLDIEGLNIQ